MTADTDLYGISGEQCGNDEKFGEEEIGRGLSVFSLANSMFGHTDTEPEYDHEETDSQEFQDYYRAQRLAEELGKPRGKCDSFRPAINMAKIKEKFMPANYPYRFRQSVST